MTAAPLPDVAATRAEIERLTKGQAAALKYVSAVKRKMLSDFPGTTSLFALSWHPREPVYCWQGAYGFTYQSLESLRRRGLIKNPEGYKTSFYTTDEADRLAQLQEQSK